jgi:hypothetical protein
MKNHSNTGSYSAGFGVTGVAHLGIVERGPDSKESTLDGFRDLGPGDVGLGHVPKLAPEAVHHKWGAHKGWSCL